MNSNQRLISRIGIGVEIKIYLFEKLKLNFFSFAIGRMYYAHPTSGEHYYLQMLLNFVKGATSYDHLRTVDGTEHDTFKDACIAMGLLTNDNE